MDDTESPEPAAPAATPRPIEAIVEELLPRAQQHIERLLRSGLLDFFGSADVEAETITWSVSWSITTDPRGAHRSGRVETAIARREPGPDGARPLGVEATLRQLPGQLRRLVAQGGGKVGPGQES